MTLQAPVIVIAPSLRNDFLMLARDLLPDAELRGALNNPESYYSKRRAEIRLLLDLLLPAADASVVTTSAPRVTQPAKPLTGRQLLR